jgi:hypothetical protein
MEDGHWRCGLPNVIRISLMLTLASLDLSAFGVDIAVYMIAPPWKLSSDQALVLKSLPLLACYAQDSDGNGFGRLVFRDK